MTTEYDGANEDVIEETDQSDFDEVLSNLPKQETQTPEQKAEEFQKMFQKAYPYAMNTVVELCRLYCNISASSNSDELNDLPQMIVPNEGVEGPTYKIYCKVVDKEYSMTHNCPSNIWELVRTKCLPFVIYSAIICFQYIQFDKADDLEYADIVDKNLKIDQDNTTLYLDPEYNKRIGLFVEELS